MKILVVEDMIASLMATHQYLKNMGHSVIAAKNGQEAIILYESDKPDLILMDMVMPIMDGPETITKIRALEKNDAHVPIILLTSLTNEEDIQAGVEAGADDYLIKPVTPALLETKINSLLKK